MHVVMLKSCHGYCTGQRVKITVIHPGQEYRWQTDTGTWLHISEATTLQEHRSTQRDCLWMLAKSTMKVLVNQSGTFKDGVITPDEGKQIHVAKRLLKLAEKVKA